MEGEMLASCARHADNVAPCIFGGFTLVRSTEPLDVVQLDFPPLYVTVIHPQIEIKTSEARAVLPKEVPLEDAVRNWSNLGAFVAALGKGDYDLMRRSMEDVIIEPARKSLIPQFDDVKAACLAAGAIGGGISGSGPSIFALSTSLETATRAEAAMRDVYARADIEFNLHVSRVGAEGKAIE
jgi:homoserine kinase